MLVCWHIGIAKEVEVEMEVEVDSWEEARKGLGRGGFLYKYPSFPYTFNSCLVISLDWIGWIG